MTRRSQPLPSDWPQLRALTLARDNYVCQLAYPGCTHTASHVDHIIPASQGGTDHPTNLQSACPNCHNRKTAAEANTARWANAPRRTRPPEQHPGLL
jgi:5-methylcytosine-specific restriction endonuclease McrA